MIRSASIQRSISHFLTSPSIVANSLNWKKNSGSLLSLLISKDKIDLVLASHPQFEEHVQMMKPIRLITQKVDNLRILDESVSLELAKIIRTYNVCGMIVGWPVEREGWCGASCGRVLYTLDKLSDCDTDERVMKTNRPVCLYDLNHHNSSEDEWGRSVVYCKTSDETVHVSSEESSFNCAYNSVGATALWYDFRETYWPQFTLSRISHLTLSEPESHENECEAGNTRLTRSDLEQECFNFQPAA
jgi:hypothetical protein